MSAAYGQYDETEAQIKERKEIIIQYVRYIISLRDFHVCTERIY